MRIATWNVNSIRTRADLVASWLTANDIDVLAMQEIKCTPAQFPYTTFEALGYEVIAHGLNQWNGVAFASRLPMHHVQTSFTGMPGFKKDTPPEQAPLEARALGITVEDVDLWSLYVPNGRALNDPHYQYKLSWLKALTQATKTWLNTEHTQLALLGDWNIAPLEQDVGDRAFIPGRSTHVSPAERAAFQVFETLGMTDVVRAYEPTGYTYWDYTRGCFAKDEGLRIDFILGSPAFTSTVTHAHIAKDQRALERPSDHVPVVVERQSTEHVDFDEAMVFSGL